MDSLAVVNQLWNFIIFTLTGSVYILPNGGHATLKMQTYFQMQNEYICRQIIIHQPARIQCENMN